MQHRLVWRWAGVMRHRSTSARSVSPVSAVPIRCKNRPPRVHSWEHSPWTGYPPTTTTSGQPPPGAGPLSEPRMDHIFATVARIDKLLGYSERGRRTTSEYTIYLIKLARPENISELFDIFGWFSSVFWKKFWFFSKKYENFEKIWKFSDFFKNFENFNKKKSKVKNIFVPGSDFEKNCIFGEVSTQYVRIRYLRD